MRKKIFFIFLAALTVLSVSCKPKLDNTNTGQGENTSNTPAVEVQNQTVKNGSVTVMEVFSDGPGWVVVHADNSGQPGEILGQASVNGGINESVSVKVDESKVTTKLFAMLHADTGSVGVFEFPGADEPIKVDGQVVIKPFHTSGDVMEDKNPTMEVPVPGMENIDEMIIQDSDDDEASIRSFKMTAKKWEFDPETITVEEGDTVRLSVTSIDVDHGIAIPQFGVSEKLEAGKTVDFEFVADKKGSFTFFCNVSCGAGHSSMKGTLVVQ